MANYQRVWCILVTALILAAEGYQRKQSPKRIDELVDKASYSKDDPPNKSGVTEVGIGIYVNSFYAVSEQTMDYSIGMYFRQNWSDPRLAHTPIDLKTNNTHMADAWKTIWVPDTFFRNEKRSVFHRVTVENRMTKIYPNGVVWYVMKLTATLSCPMVLNKYPLDTQKCPMVFESFGYTTDTVRLTWLTPPTLPVEKADDSLKSLPQFSYETFEAHNCTQNYTSGSSSCLQINFVLRRSIGYYFIQLFVPSILIVILSWVSFWINVDAAPARVSLGLLTVLTMTNHSIGINTNLPRVSYIKAVDVWMSSCLLFVFAALCEYAFVNVASRKRVISKTPPSADKKVGCACENCFQKRPLIFERDDPMAGGGGGGGGGIIAPVPATKPNKSLEQDGKGRARRIDKIARKSFPLAFVLFNCAYWVLYTCIF